MLTRSEVAGQDQGGTRNSEARRACVSCCRYVMPALQQLTVHNVAAARYAHLSLVRGNHGLSTGIEPGTTFPNALPFLVERRPLNVERHRMRLGVISDTHGRLHGRVFEVFEGVDHILHAGDIGDDAVLDDLETIAAVSAVSGNMDGMPTKRRPLKFVGEFAGLRIGMTHGHLLDAADYNRSALQLFQSEKPQVIIHGHTHRAKNQTQEGVAILNPGAAWRPRSGRYPTVAIMEIGSPGGFVFKVIELKL